MTVVQAPLDLSRATRVGPRVYRKQVLAKRAIDYPLPDGTTQRVDFNDAYLRDLAAAYNDGAYDMVPFQLADAANRHNEDPRQYGGRVIGAEVTPDGLDLILELSEEAAELVEKTGRRLGVSPRIKAVQHVDGRTFKRAIRHVLGTLDPRMQNMTPWQPVVDLAADGDEPVLDLSSYTYRKAAAMPNTLDLSTLTDEQLESLGSWAAAEGVDLSETDPETDAPGNDRTTYEDDGADADEDGDGQPDADQDDADQDGEVTDDELDALIDAELANAGTGRGFADPTDLSNPDDADLDLAAYATARDDDQVDLSDDDDDEDPLAENRRLRLANARGHYLQRGVPPHLVDLAAPVLQMADADARQLDLATPDGEPLDVRAVVRGMLDAVAGTIDLSAESGYGHDDNDDGQAVATKADQWLDYLNNN